MALACSHIRQGLLMYIHGQLSLGARVATMAHLAVCPECRLRKEELAKATSVLASAVRGSGMPAWRPHFSFWFGRETLLIGGTVAAVAVMCLSYWYSFGAPSQSEERGSRGGKQLQVMVSGTSIRADGTRAKK